MSPTFLIPVKYVITSLTLCISTSHTFPSVKIAAGCAFTGLDGTDTVLYFFAFFLGGEEERRSALLPIRQSLEGKGLEGEEWDNEEWWFFNMCFFTESSTVRSLQRSSVGIDREFLNQTTYTSRKGYTMSSSN